MLGTRSSDFRFTTFFGGSGFGRDPSLILWRNKMDDYYDYLDYAEGRCLHDGEDMNGSDSEEDSDL